ncbi:hypothetical protein HS7_07640 [Sulfolobales archaeon HS-7]|nr:hypothetical protein HS7_07640 [Sulfolobales archaeon HS-7]
MEYNEPLINKVFPRDGYYETLVGTSGIETKVKPIGVIKKSILLIMKLYQGTLTLSNIIKYPFCTINITSDIPVFYYSILGNIQYNIEYGLPYIPDAFIIFCRCEIVSDGDPVEVKVIPFHFMGEPRKSINRGELILLDILVNITRLNIYSGIEKDKLINIINYEIGVVKKTSPWLLSIIDQALKRYGYTINDKITTL